MATGTLYVDNSNNIVWAGLRTRSTGSYVNDAIVTAVVYDQNGNVVAGCSSISLTYTASSNGEYRGLIASTVQLTDGTQYRVVATASNYGVKTDTWFTAAFRTG